jgi:hypothetical protein
VDFAAELNRHSAANSAMLTDIKKQQGCPEFFQRVCGRRHLHWGNDLRCTLKNSMGVLFAQLLAMLRSLFFRAKPKETDSRGVSLSCAVLQQKKIEP